MNKLHENQLLIASISNRNILEKTIHLEPEIFLNYNCQKIFDIIVRMYHENQSISITTMGLEIQNAYPELKQSFVSMVSEKSQQILEHEADQIIEKMKDLYEKYVIDCLIVDYKKKKIDVKEFREKVSNVEESESSEIFDMSDYKDMTLDEIFPKQGYIKYPKELQPLNDFLGGMFTGNVIFITGKPASGKTTLGMQIVKDLSALFFSLEMKTNELYAKILTSKTGVSTKRTIMCELSEKESMEQLISHEKEAEKLKIKYSNESRLIRMISLARKQKGKFDIMLVDNFQIVSANGSSRTEQLDTISRAFKLLSTELDVPIIVIVHLKKEFMKDNVKPSLDAIYGSGAPAKDASEILCLWDKTETEPDVGEVRKTIISILKSRFSGVGDIEGLNFNKKRSRFEINHFENYCEFD